MVQVSVVCVLLFIVILFFFKVFLFEVNIILTFDMNCIISVEKDENSSFSLKQLINLHDQEKITISVPAISANEKLKTGEYLDNFTEFKVRINKISKRPMQILKPLCYLGMCFLDYCILGDDELEHLDKGIHNIIFPQIDFLWEKYANSYGIDINHLDSKWLNDRCDDISMWCHIYYKNDIFVTNDDNFHKPEKHKKLINLGAKQILRPDDTWRLINYSLLG